MYGMWLTGLKTHKGVFMCVADLLLPKERLALGICKDVTQHPRHRQYELNIIMSSVTNYNDL